MNEKKSAAAVSVAPLSPASDRAAVTEALSLYRKMTHEQRAEYLDRLRSKTNARF